MDSFRVLSVVTSVLIRTTALLAENLTKISIIFTTSSDIT